MHEQVPSKEIFDFFKENEWNLIEAPRREVCVSDQDFTCSGLNLNFLLLGPSKVVLEKKEKGTMKFLKEELGADCIGDDFEYAFEFGGAFNCWTVDTVRDGGAAVKSYFDGSRDKLLGA